MKRFYFKDTDTLVFQFSDERITDVVDLDYQTLLELDCDGNPVALTIEHARERDVLRLPDASAPPAARIAPTAARAHAGPG